MAMKKPWLAALLSFIIAGLGQFYVGRLWRGLFFFTVELLTAGFFEVNYAVGMVLNMFVSIAAAVDAYHLAKKINVELKGRVESEPEMSQEIRVY
jgi:TM2 domain-containing membrane protein YozV